MHASMLIKLAKYAYTLIKYVYDYSYINFKNYYALN